MKSIGDVFDTLNDLGRYTNGEKLFEKTVTMIPTVEELKQMAMDAYDAGRKHDRDGLEKVFSRIEAMK